MSSYSTTQQNMSRAAGSSHFLLSPLCLCFVRIILASVVLFVAVVIMVMVGLLLLPPAQVMAVPVTHVCGTAGGGAIIIITTTTRPRLISGARIAAAMAEVLVHRARPIMALAKAAGPISLVVRVCGQ